MNSPGSTIAPAPSPIFGLHEAAHAAWASARDSSLGGNACALDLLDDLSDAIDYAVVGPRDSRIHEIQTTHFPWNTICHLSRDFGNGRWSGCTGALVGPQVVLTAGHCVYNHLRRSAPLRIRVSPGRASRDVLPFGWVISSEYFVPRRFVEARFPNIRDRQNFDYGVIILPRAFPGITSFMAVEAPNDAQLERLRHSKLFIVAGYPGDRPSGTLWRHAERIRRITPRRIYYTMDTCPGHSGSPVFYTRPQDGERVIVGIHTSGIVDERGRAYGCSRDTVVAPPGLMNAGVRITEEVLHNVRAPNRVPASISPMLKLPRPRESM